MRQYEVTDHLGNVLATLSGKRTGATFTPLAGGLTPGADARIDTWKPIVVSAHDYYPFGQYMPGRYSADTLSHCVATTFTGMGMVPYTVVIPPPAAGDISLYGSAVVTYLSMPTVLHMVCTTATSGLFTVLPPVSAQGTHVLVDVGAITNNHTFTVRDNTTGIILGATSHGTSTSAGLVSIALSPVPHSTSLSLIVECTDPTGGDLYCNGIVLPRDTLTAINIHGNVCSADAYQYGYNGKMNDNEWAGLGYHIDYGDRGLDTRTGRWQTPDKLQAKYPGMSPYAYCANSPIVFLDPDGNDVHVYLSAKPVGTTQIRLIQPSGDNGGAPKTVEVPLYQMTVTSDASKKVSTYFVTRDGPILNSADPVDKAWMPWNDDEYNVVNTAFEPTKDNAMFNLVPLAYPIGMEAYALRNPDGTPELSAEPNESPFRKKKGEAEGVMIHVGGVYIDADGNTRITGSEGCLTLSGKDEGNAGIKRFVNDVNQRKKEDKAAGKGNDVDLKIQKRTGVESNWKVDKDGKKQ